LHKYKIIFYAGTINFAGNAPYAHFKFQFDTKPAPVDQDIGKTSYLAFAMVVLVVLVMANYDRLSLQAKEIVDSYAYSGGMGVSAATKKSKSKTK